MPVSVYVSATQSITYNLINSAKPNAHGHRHESKEREHEKMKYKEANNTN